MIDIQRWRDIQKKVAFKGDYDENLALPNELFKKLVDLVKEGKLKSSHIGFTYSYIYLQTYMYRYAKYGYSVPTAAEIKAILGYSESNKQVDYIIKKNGLLEQEGILLTTNDFPTVVQYDEEEKFVISTIGQLDYAKEFREAKGLTKNQYCKYPVFGYHSTYEGYLDGESYDGTFFYSERTHIIEFKAFAFCMANEAIGVNGFYLYCYIKHKNDTYRDDYKVTAKRLSQETTFSERSIKRYLDGLRSYRVVDTTHEQEFFVIGLYDSSKRKASGHYANKYAYFSWDRVLYEKLKPITLEKYKELKQRRQQQASDGLDNLFADQY